MTEEQQEDLGRREHKHMQRLRRHPVMIEADRHRYKTYTVMPPERVLAEQWTAAVHALDPNIGNIFWRDGRVPAKSEHRVRTCLSRALFGAESVLWNTEVRKVALGAKVPRIHFDDNLIPAPVYWTYFPRTALQSLGPNTSTIDRDYEKQMMGVGQLFFQLPGDSTRLISCICTHPKSPEYSNGEEVHRMDYQLWPIPLSKTYPDEFPEEIKASVGMFIALQSFLNSPYLGREKVHVKNGVRKQCEKRGKATPPTVTTILLRRYTPERSDASEQGEGVDTEWSCRWLVSGHIRNQWYGKEQGHKPIWIAPYIKGPGDKPLRDRIFQVVR